MTATTSKNADDLRVVYFASVRQQLGLDGERTPGAATVRELLTALAARSTKHAAVFSETAGLCFAINQEFAEIDDAIPAGAEVAIFPPVTGG